jgi:hypothetical protein
LKKVAKDALKYFSFKHFWGINLFIGLLWSIYVDVFLFANFALEVYYTG